MKSTVLIKNQLMVINRRLYHHLQFNKIMDVRQNIMFRSSKKDVEHANQ